MAPREVPLPSLISRHLHHHGRFYLALLIGVLSFAVARYLQSPLSESIGGDAFFASFLILSWRLIFRLTTEDLRRRADIEDEGGIVVALITLVAIAHASIAVFSTLHGGRLDNALELSLALAGAPLSWFMLHTVSALRYAHLYYKDDEDDGYVAPLKFPECVDPGPWDFVYLSLVVGMTAQVSDVLVQTTPMRQNLTAHSVVSFFFNTVLIAMAVNAAVVIAT